MASHNAPKFIQLTAALRRIQPVDEAELGKVDGLEILPPGATTSFAAKQFVVVDAQAGTRPARSC